MPRRNLATQKTVAQLYQVTERTVRNWITRGLITGYRLPGSRAVRLDLDEVDRALTTIPAVGVEGTHVEVGVR